MSDESLVFSNYYGLQMDSWYDKKNGEKKVVKIVFFHLLEFQENGYENWLDSISITKKQNYLQWSTSLWQNREYCSANRFISCYSTEVYSTELQHLTASYCITYFIFYEFPFFKFNRLTLRRNHGPICRSGSYVMLPLKYSYDTACTDT